MSTSVFISAIYVTSCYDFGALQAPDEVADRVLDGRAADGAQSDGRQLDGGRGDSQPDKNPRDASEPPLACNVAQTGRGPLMVGSRAPRDAGLFCIDATEVTRNQYAQFLAETPSTYSQIAACQWNKTFVPSKHWPDGAPRTSDHPITYIDWCDAYAFCQWAGKALCGDLDGGPHAFFRYAEPADASTDRWRVACTHAEDGMHEYPYGNTYDSLACNGKDQARGIALPAGSSPKCVGGFSGIFDMSGNVNEWENSCQPTKTDDGPAKDLCILRGGSFTNSSDGVRCASAFVTTRDYAGDDVGFRCCSR
ncbi:formylglycine-generating enzyme family protein [Pendulispora albinea]|uniref:Formylglycine-generating enzyme family protein n=1 Tax=Pendulispora albinea TaxID=2741071 RepID=A0ABZ2LMW9_9BACT